jgi:hypothetical protein
MPKRNSIKRSLKIIKKSLLRKSVSGIDFASVMRIEMAEEREHATAACASAGLSISALTVVLLSTMISMTYLLKI